MGVVNYPILDLIQKVRSWVNVLPDVLSESLMSAVGEPAMCLECGECLGASGFAYRCQSCFQLICRKCVLGAPSMSNRAEPQPLICNFCFRGDNGPWETMRQSGSVSAKISLVSPKSPLSRSSTERLSQLAEPRRFSSPRSLCCSTYRTYEEDQGDDEGKEFFTPMSLFSQDSSDIDSISAANDLSSFRSANSSPFDSPCKPVEQGLLSPELGKTDLLDRGSPGRSRKYGAESEDLPENSNDCTSESLAGCHDQENQKLTQHFDFENDRIFYPPFPEDEQDDIETNFFGYTDEDDDDDGDSAKLFKSCSFSGDPLQTKEKSNESHKKALRNAVDAHFRALVSQLLKGEGVHTGSDLEGPDWLEVISKLAGQAANFVKPDTSHGGSMDPGDYVKVKCIASGRPNDSMLVKGVVCTKNVKYKRMVSQHQNPRLLLLGGALEYQKVPNELASIGAVLEQETNFMKMALSKIEALRPNVLLVEKSVSSYAQEYLFGKKEISLVLNVKKSLLERISRCTGAQIVPSIDYVASSRLGHCEMFRIEKVYDEFSSCKHVKKSSKTLMFFEGCPRPLGCTVLLRGASLEELKKLKHVVRYASFAAYHLSLETSFLADEGASLPKLPVGPSVTSKKHIVADDVVLPVAGLAAPDDHSVGYNLKKDRSFNKLDIERLSLSSDVMNLNKEILVHSADEQKNHSLIKHNNNMDGLSVPYPENRVISFKSNADVCLYGSKGSTTAFHCKEKTCISSLSTDVNNQQGILLEQYVKERINLSTDRLLRSDDGHQKSDISFKNEVPGGYFSTAENHQSILVSLSITCIKKSRVCERSQLFRIKFYGSFDKPLGRYLRDDLFDEAFCCQSCKEPTEAHVRCYTHQQGSLTIMVRRLPSVKKLSFECDERIWMWHRCLKCEKDKDGVPPAAPRVIMSDAAWGLSFGKFLELSFSSHATANRIASCGHSLQRDCLRFYGFGDMVAFFHYSPVDILSVCLPPSVLDFTCHVQQEWLRQEALMISSKINILHHKISDVLYAMERKVTTSEDEPLKASIHRHVIKLKDLLSIERHDYDVLLQSVTVGNIQSIQLMVDILELNRLRRALLLDSYMWDRRLYSLGSISKEKGCTISDAPLTIFSSKSNLREWKEETVWKDGAFRNLTGEVTAKLSFSGVSQKSSFLKQHEDPSLQILDCNTNSMVEMDLSIESIEGYTGSVGSNFVSNEYEYLDDTSICGDTESTNLENSTSTTSSLSEQIDLAWSGSGQLAMDQPKGSSEADTDGFLMDNACYRRVKFPLRVHSFDSALRYGKSVHGGFLPASLHLPTVKSLDSSGDLAMARDPLASMRRAYSQSSPRVVVTQFDNLLNNTPVHISSVTEKMTDGARLLLPQSSLYDIVIAVYDDEPSSIISYAMTSQEYGEYITSCLDEVEDFSKILKMNGIGNHVNNYMESTSLVSHHSEIRPDEPQFSRVNLLDPKETHFRVSFDDEFSIPSDKAKFSVTCYFAKQFHALRKKCCPSELDYIRSLSRCKRWSAQGGKSNVYFAKSLDERFIIKQITKTELDSFEDFAPQYFKYLTQSITSGSPTCLAKVLGIYQVAMKHSKGGRELKIDVMVMENLFFERNVSRVYDLKGSVRSRYNPDTSGSNTVLLDLNLLETKPIFLGSKAKRRLERAVWNDTSFLASVDVMDYSLLVGIDEMQKELVIGIIDYMRQYTWDKQLETWVKASGILGGPKNAAPTVISPLQYKKRFRKAMSNYFLTVPDQWSS